MKQLAHLMDENTICNRPFNDTSPKGSFKPAAIILAAGLSSRMNGNLKALAKIGKITLLERTVENFRLCGLVDIFLVYGHQGETLKKEAEKLNISAVYNPDYKEGMFSSLKAGLRALPPTTEAFFIMPVDAALVAPSSILRLLRQWQKRANPNILVPAFKNQSGHPPLINSCFINEILQYCGTGGLRAWMNSSFNFYKTPQKKQEYHQEERKKRLIREKFNQQYKDEEAINSFLSQDSDGSKIFRLRNTPLGQKEASPLRAMEFIHIADEGIICDLDTFEDLDKVQKLMQLKGEEETPQEHLFDKSVYIRGEKTINSLLGRDAGESKIFQLRNTPLGLCKKPKFQLKTKNLNYNTMPSLAEAWTLLLQCPLSKEKLHHHLKVAASAFRLTYAFEKLGFKGLNPKLSLIAGLLHDMDRQKKNHALEASKRLKKFGWAQVAEAISFHMDISSKLLSEMINSIQNATILPWNQANIISTLSLHLADKYWWNDKAVSIKERFELSLYHWRSRLEPLKRAKHSLLKRPFNHGYRGDTMPLDGGEAINSLLGRNSSEPKILQQSKAPREPSLEEILKILLKKKKKALKIEALFRKNLNQEPSEIARTFSGHIAEQGLLILEKSAPFTHCPQMLLNHSSLD